MSKVKVEALFWQGGMRKRVAGYGETTREAVADAWALFGWNDIRPDIMARVVAELETMGESEHGWVTFTL